MGEFSFYIGGKTRDYINTDLFVLSESAPIEEIINIFISHDRWGAAVIDKNGLLSGIIRHEDLLAIFTKHEFSVVGVKNSFDIMHSPPPTIGVNETMISALRKAFSSGSPFIIVVDEKDNPIGSLDSRDFLKALRTDI